MTKLNNHSGFSAVEALLILVIVGLLGFTGWFVYHSQKAASKDYSSQSSMSQSTPAKKSTKSTVQSAKTKAMASWPTFSNTTLGLTFKYPSELGQATLQVMHPTSDASNPTFYKVSFSKSTYAYMTVKPASAVSESDVTFSNLQTDNVKYASSRHIFVNESTVAGDVQPDQGNQQSALYAARSINLSKVKASYVLLVDARQYGGSCSQATYAICYTADELQNYQWMLESVTAL